MKYRLRIIQDVLSTIELEFEFFSDALQCIEAIETGATTKITKYQLERVSESEGENES